jgi:hypothetical protein
MEITLPTIRRAAAFTTIAPLLLAAGSLPSAAPLTAAPVRSAKAACERVKARVSAAEHFPASIVAFCGPIGSADSPPGFYVLALHSYRKCDGICSSNMGWFAVEKRSGRVFAWDVAEMKLGQPLKIRR